MVNLVQCITHGLPGGNKWGIRGASQDKVVLCHACRHLMHGRLGQASISNKLIMWDIQDTLSSSKTWCNKGCQCTAIMHLQCLQVMDIHSCTASPELVQYVVSVRFLVLTAHDARLLLASAGPRMYGSDRNTLCRKHAS